MNPDVEAFTAGYLRVTQVRKKIEEMEIGAADVFLTFSSFDPRCLALSEAQFTSYSTVVVAKFSSTRVDDPRKRHATILKDRLSKFGPVIPLDLPRSVEADEVISSLKSLIVELFEKAGRPIRLALDMSCLPKTYLLFLCAFVLRNGLASTIDCYYSEAIYPNLGPSVAPLDFAYTDGPWISYQVPFLEGRFHPGRPRHAIVSMGTEIASLEKFLARYEPDGVTLVTPVPGITSELDGLAKTLANAVRRSLGSTEILDLPARNLVSDLPLLLELIKEKLVDNDVMLFSFGPKPQALAMGLAALLISESPVVCRIPTKYMEHENLSNGWAWRYQVSDLSNPPRLSNP